VINEKFGLWRVLAEDLETAGTKKPRYLCICECGNSRLVGRYELLHGQTKSCGCRGRKTYRVSKGDVFGNWVILEEVKKKDGCRYFKCECGCGFISEVRLKSLISKESRSCGCQRKKFAKQNKLIN